MSDEDFTTNPSGHESNQQPAADPAGWGEPQPNYTQTAYPPPPPPPQGYAPPPQNYAPPPAAEGLSDNTACALAYVTFIPALIFLLVPPYNQKPAIKFHAIQELCLSVILFILSFFLVIPILGQLVYLVGGLVLLIAWVLCIIKASQGNAFKLPLIGNFAAEQSGYRI
jgi:uncharacterized membrane protein